MNDEINSKIASMMKEVREEGVNEIVRIIQEKLERELGFLTIPGHFSATKYGRFALSIQASEHHYSRPHENFSTLKEYESVEVAIFEMVNGKEEWVIPTRDGRFKYSSWACCFSDDGDTSVAACVSWDTVRDIIKDLLHEV